MTDSEQFEFQLDPEVEQTFQRKCRQRQRKNHIIMENHNNNNNPANQNVPEQNLVYLAHDLDNPIRSYASLNLYDFNPGIAYLGFGKK